MYKYALRKGGLSCRCVAGRECTTADLMDTSDTGFAANTVGPCIRI